MRLPALLFLLPLAAPLLAACGPGGPFSSSAEVQQCEQALAVLVRTGANRAPFTLDDEAEAPRRIDGRAGKEVTLTYIQNRTRKLVSCFYVTGTAGTAAPAAVGPAAVGPAAVGYVFEGRRLTGAETAAINRQL